MSDLDPSQPSDDEEAALLQAAKELGAVRAVMGALEARLPDIQAGIESNVQARTRPWKILAGVALLVGLGGVAVGVWGVTEASDARDDLEVAVVGGCDNANEVRQGVLNTLMIFGGGQDPLKSDDPELRQTAEQFILKKCDFDVLIREAKKAKED